MEIGGDTKAVVLAAGLIFLWALLLGAWKYREMAAAEDGLAHPYVDVAHRAALLYSFATLLLAAFDAAGARLGDYPTWGDMHRLTLAHPLSFAPVIGKRYRFGDFPADGSSDTLMKTAHSATDQRHYTRYGQQARHLSDLSDMDRNWFLLLGGQDGWFGSSTAFDQAKLWVRGDYIQLPMRADTLEKWSYRTMKLGR